MSTNTPTAHIAASPADIAPVVLMPGDPNRSRFVAENFLEGAALFNNVRGVQGYTGTYRGERVSVMASGMGMPSIGIYSYELYNFFGTRAIIRIGTAGAMQEEVKVRDLLIGMACATDTNFASQYHLPGVFPAVCSPTLLTIAAEEAKKSGKRHHIGTLLSSDIFYNDCPEDMKKWEKMGVLGVEMEAAALYYNAARANRHALAICTASNHLITGEETTAKERETTFTDMMEVALATALRFTKEA